MVTSLRRPTLIDEGVDLDHRDGFLEVDVYDDVLGVEALYILIGRWRVNPVVQNNCPHEDAFP